MGGGRFKKKRLDTEGGSLTEWCGEGCREEGNASPSRPLSQARRPTLMSRSPQETRRRGF